MNYYRILRNNNKISINSSSASDLLYTVPDFTLRCVFSGDEEYYIGHRKLLIYPGSFLKLNKGTRYTSSSISHVPVQSLTLSFDQRFVSDFSDSWTMSDDHLLDREGNGDYADNLSETLYPFCGDIKFTISHLKENLENGLGDELLINEYLHHCLINFFGLYERQVYQRADRLNFINKSTRVEILRRLNLAREYLHSNYDQNIGLEDIAAYSCLSVNHFLRTFKQAFGTSPHQYLKNIRLTRAKQLLKTTDYPVYDIVNLIGFECPCSFNKLFKKQYNISPLQYRKSA